MRSARTGAGGSGAGGAAGVPVEVVNLPDTLPDSEWVRALRDEAQAEMAAERAVADASRDSALAGWPGPEVSYLEHPEEFEQDYQAARLRRTRGEDAVPFMTENATDGLGARDGGRPFGVEIEFDVAPGNDQAAALAAIGRDLHAAGLTTTAYQEGYHTDRRRRQEMGHQGGWRFERDGTVAAEIVSPIMYDEPETWQNLQRVCEIVRRHGGIATYRTGGHVHVGLSDYDHTVGNHNRLLATVAGYRDTVYRLAQNPARPGHRGLNWCAPNRNPGTGYASISQVRSGNNSHHVGVNFESVAGRQSDHVEFRMWDGSLNPGVIQAQVNLSLAMTAAGSRGGYTPPPPENVGDHRRANPDGRRLRGDQWREATRGFRGLADTVFRRRANAAQAAALFAVTRWQHG